MTAPMLILLLALAGQPTSPPATEAPAAPSPAVQEAGRGVQEACAADTRVLCGEVKPGGGRIMQCFRAKFRELSPLCRAALGDLRRARKAG